MQTLAKRISTILIIATIHAGCNTSPKIDQPKDTALSNISKTAAMNKQDFTTTILVDQSPNKVFDAVNNVRGWWSQEIDGSTDSLNAIFLYHYKDVHICKMKIVEMIPNKKVVWLVLANHFNFTKDSSEWVGTKIIFDIAEKNGKAVLHFTHDGLVPQYECYKICNDAWTNYIQNSLQKLITTGKGEPNAKEGGFNSELMQKWNLKE